MDLKQIDCGNLPLNELIKDYLSDNRSFTPHFQQLPADLLEDPKTLLSQKNPQLSFKDTYSLLSEFNSSLDTQELCKKGLTRMRDADSFYTVTTGQQLGVAGGPLYTIYKTLSTIQLARRLEEETGETVIPIFWIADEDHDFEEISHVTFPFKDEVKSHTLSEAQPGLPVADQTLSDDVDDFFKSLKDDLFDTEFSDDLFDLLQSCYKSGKTHGHAFGQLMANIFGKHGVVLAGSNSASIKEAVNPLFKKAISEPSEVLYALQEGTNRIKSEYHQQAGIDASLIFYFDDGKRIRLAFDDENDLWHDHDKSLQFTSDKLLEVADSKPELLSPNVFLRPIIEEYLLPNIAYVGGPGEISYWAQMKELFELFDVSEPVLWPRFTATILGNSIQRYWDDLPFTFCEYIGRIEDIESEYLERSDQFDLNAFFGNWIKEVQELNESKKEQIAKVDQSLVGTAGKASSVYINELNKLRGKLTKSIKQQEETQLNRIRKIHREIYPEHNLQERQISFIYFMNKYGLDLWDQILEEIDIENYHSHTMIFL